MSQQSRTPSSRTVKKTDILTGLQQPPLRRAEDGLVHMIALDLMSSHQIFAVGPLEKFTIKNNEIRGTLPEAPPFYTFEMNYIGFLSLIVSTFNLLGK